jgi:hypothetical protein
MTGKNMTITMRKDLEEFWAEINPEGMEIIQPLRPFESIDSTESILEQMGITGEILDIEYFENGLRVEGFSR